MSHAPTTTCAPSWSNFKLVALTTRIAKVPTRAASQKLTVGRYKQVPMTEQCPKCYRRIGIVRADVATVGSLLKHDYSDCGAILIVTKSGPAPCEFELRLATDAEQNGAPA